jgi:hypothetical protein
MQARRKGMAVMGLLALLGSTGCAGAGLVAAQAASDLRCPEKEISVTSGDMGSYEARGCGRSQRYVVRGGEVLPDVGGD